jgi:hypothetical protein
MMSVTESDVIDLAIRIEELEAENKVLRGLVPAYELPPCECCRKFTDYYAAECDCGNPGDHEAAVRWCTRMEIADSFDEAIDAARGDK